MKARKTNDLRELATDELVRVLRESEETLTKQKWEHSLKTLKDPSYLRILRKDIARMNTVLNER